MPHVGALAAKLVAVAAALIVLGLPSGAHAQEYPPATGEAAISDSTPNPGGLVTVAAGGFAANASTTLTMESTPVMLGTARADGAGRVSTQVRIPADAAPGEHMLKVSGAAPNGAMRVVAARIMVVARPESKSGTAFSAESPESSPPSKSRTGFTGAMVLPLVGVAITLLVVGGVLWAHARRRRPGPVSP